MANKQGKISAEIVLELKQLRSDILAANKLFSNFASDALKQNRQSASGVEKTWKASYAMLSMYAVRAAGKITSAFGDTVKVFANFEQSLANTQSVAQATEEEFTLLEEAARRVGATTRSTAADAANGLYYLASAGFSARESIDALDGVNAFAIATNTDLAKSSEFVATTIRQYGLETRQATDVANVFTAAITNSLATADKLANAFEYVGPIAAGLGISVEKTTGALQVLFNQGFSGEKAGRALRRILVDLADSTSVVNTKLSRLGITFEEVNPATNELGDIFDTLREKGVDATNAAAIFGKISGAQLQALIKYSSDAKDGINELTEEVTGTNAAFTAMEVQMDTLQGSFDQLKNATEALKISTGKGLILRPLIDTATQLIRVLAELNPDFLAASAAIGTVVAASIALAAGITGISSAMAAAGIGIAALIPGFNVLAAAMVGATVVTAGLVVGVKELEKVNLRNLNEEFQKAAQETNVTKEELNDFLIKARAVRQSLNYMVPATATTDAKKLRDEINKLAKQYGLTEKQVFLIAEENGRIKELAGDTLEIVRNQFAAEEAQAAARIKAGEDTVNIEILHLQKLKELEDQYKVLNDAAEEQSNNVNEAYESLKTAFSNAAEYAKVLGDEYDRDAELVSAYNNSIKLLIEQGLSAESEQVQGLIQLYSDLQAYYGKVDRPVNDDTQKRIDAQKAIVDGLKEIDEYEKLAVISGEDYNAAKEKSKLVLDEVSKLVEEGFTIEGPGIQKILDEYGDLIIKKQERNALEEEYNKKLSELTLSQDDLVKAERNRALLAAEGNKEAEDAINAYFDEVERGIELAKDETARQQVLEYTDKIDNLTLSEQELIEKERERALASVNGNDQAIAAANKYFDLLEKRSKLDKFKENFKIMADTVGKIFSSLTDLANTYYDKQIEKIEEARDAEIEALDERLAQNLDTLDAEAQAALAAAGIYEQTERDKLVAAVERAEEAGDVEAEEAAQTALRKYDILQDFEARRERLEDDAAEKRTQIEDDAQRDIAEAQYKADMFTWSNSLFQAGTSAALAIINALTIPPPFGEIAAAGLAVATAAQVSNIMMNKPERPSFETGGIVPGSSFTGDNVLADVNSGELILARAQQDRIAEQLEGSSQDTPIIIQVPVTLDGREIAMVTAEYYRNGVVRL